MESRKNNIRREKRKFKLYEHPWISLLAIILTTLLSSILSGILIFGLIRLSDASPIGQFVMAMTYHILTVFILAPFVLRLPKGKRTFRQYLNDIRLTRIESLTRLVLLSISCYVFLAMSQAATSFVYRFFEGRPINSDFIWNVFNLSVDLPPHSSSLLLSFPSIFEEVAFRGIVLTVFLNKYSERESIIFSSIGFGLIHILNLINGRELVWVMGQVLWVFTIGLFYGYIFVRTKSLTPPMIVHYLGNAFIGSLTGYMQSNASIEIQTLYGVILSLGVVPTTLMIWWTKFFLSKWLASSYDPISEK